MAGKPIIIGGFVIFIAAFMLFWIFDNVNRLAERCQTEDLEICKQLTGPTLAMLALLLIISGFIFVSLVVVYILLSA
jgi:hypothetical protein